MITEERTAKLHTLKVMVGFDPQQCACHLHSVEKVCQELHWLQDAEELVWEGVGAPSGLQRIHIRAWRKLAQLVKYLLAQA